MLIGLGGFRPCDRVSCSLSWLLLLPLTRRQDCEFTLRGGTLTTSQALHRVHLQWLQHNSSRHLSTHSCGCKLSTLSHIYLGSMREFMLNRTWTQGRRRRARTA